MHVVSERLHHTFSDPGIHDFQVGNGLENVKSK